MSHRAVGPVREHLLDHGMVAVLFPGSSAGLSQAVITRLTEQWKAEQRAFAERDLSGFWSEAA